MIVSHHDIDDLSTSKTARFPSEELDDIHLELQYLEFA